MSHEENYSETIKHMKEELSENQRLHLLDLPEEIISHIISHLDGKSTLRLWEACTKLRHSVNYSLHLNYLCFAHHRIPRSINDFFEDNAIYIKELNLKCTKGFTESSIVSAIVKLDNLRSLNVRQTLVTLKGVSEMCVACPHLVDIACDITSIDESDFTSSSLKQSFKNLEGVHFAVSPGKLNALNLLERATNLKVFKLTHGYHTDLPYDNNSQHEYLDYILFQNSHPNLQFFSCSFTRRLVMTTPITDESNTWDFFIESDNRVIYVSERLCRSLPLDSTLLNSKGVMEIELRLPSPIAGKLYTFNAIRCNLTLLNSDLAKNMQRKMNAKINKTICHSGFKGTSNIQKYDTYSIICSCTHKAVNNKSESVLNKELNHKSKKGFSLEFEIKSEEVIYKEVELELESEKEFSKDSDEKSGVDKQLVKPEEGSISVESSEHRDDSKDAAHVGTDTMKYNLDLCSLLGQQANRKINLALKDNKFCVKKKFYLNCISPTNFEWLHNVVSLRLHESICPSLYKLLFQECSNLETLYMWCYDSDIQNVIQCIRLCRVIRNIHLDVVAENRTNKHKSERRSRSSLSHLFSALADCPSLENVYIKVWKHAEVQLEVSEDVMQKFFLACHDLLRLHFLYPSEAFCAHLTNITNDVLRKLNMELNIDISIIMSQYEFVPAFVDWEPILCSSENADNILDLDINSNNLKYV